jgi:hypothetical protein
MERRQDAAWGRLAKDESKNNGLVVWYYVTTQNIARLSCKTRL